MGDLRPTKPVKLICGLIAGRQEWLDAATQALMARIGPVEQTSPIWPFDYTRYYADEMGPGLLRQFVSFQENTHPGRLAAIKLQANHLEGELARTLAASVARPVNLDPGYIALDKLVLASTKDFSHRIYLADGIYAEVTLQYRQGRWRALPWTFPDYASSAYHGFFTGVRESLKAESKKPAATPLVRCDSVSRLRCRVERVLVER